MIKKYLPLLIAIILLGIAAILTFAVINTHAQAGGDLITEYIFSVQGTGDAIGIKIFNNSKWLSPLSWYQTYAPSPGKPAEITIDGYSAIRQGRSVYVGAVDVVNPETSPEVYPRIYLISYNDEATSETVEIYNQLLENWRFNINIDESVKQKLQNDMVRLQDFNIITDSLEDYHEEQGEYPVFGAGTYIGGESNSLWPSWQNTVGKVLNQSLPVDPVNEFCTVSTAYCYPNYEMYDAPCAECPNDPDKKDFQCENTCYNPATSTFSHPNESHVYQYSVPEAPECLGDWYKLKTNLEYSDTLVVWRGNLREFDAPRYSDIYLHPDDTTATQYCILQGYVKHDSYSTQDQSGSYNKYASGNWSAQSASSRIKNISCEGVEVNQSDEDGTANYVYKPEHPACGNDVLECGETCDSTNKTQLNAACNFVCEGWVCNIGWADCNSNLQIYPSDGCEIQIPAYPSGLSYEQIGSSEITLNWEDNFDGETGFNIYEQVDSSPWSQIDTVGSDITSYMRFGLNLGVQYSYLIKAYNNCVESEPSNSISVIFY